MESNQNFPGGHLPGLQEAQVPLQQAQQPMAAAQPGQVNPGMAPAPGGYQVPPQQPAAPTHAAPAIPPGAAPMTTAPTQAQPMAAPQQPAAAPAGAPAQEAKPADSPAVSARATQQGSYERATTEAQVEESDLDLSDALNKMVELGASDLHLTVNSPPLVRLHGELEPLEGMPMLDQNSVQRVLYAILTQKQRERFEAELELDFSYAMPGASRFRVNMYRQRESLGAAFRRIPYEILSLEKLGIQSTVANFAALPRGMVLVTGPTGSGKSTTLAALVDLANRTRHDHIMTVEDPIEFLHRHKSCMVNQREVGEDTHSFGNALKHVLRQDPDIILVGEMRDLETISVALTAAETGHLVFATLHTQDAGQTIDRVVDVFPPHQQQQVRTQLAGAIQGVVCQTLCRTRDGKGRVVAAEVLVATPAIRNLVREGKTHQIYSSLQAGAQHGMNTLDQHLAELVKHGKISLEHGLEKCHHVEDFNRLVGRAG